MTGSSQPPAHRPQPRDLSHRLLVIGLSNIGDGILMSSVVARLHARYPDSHLTLVVGARAKALFVEDPRVHALVDTDQFDSPFGRMKLALALQRYRPHVIVDLRHTAYPLLLKPLSLARYLRRPPASLVHMRDRHRWFLEAQAGIGGGAGEEPPALWLDPRDEAHVETLWRRWKLEDARAVVVICPGARSHIKRWTPDGFARVADRLIAEWDARIVFSGEPEEKPIIDEIMGLMHGRANNAVGLVTIRQLAGVMRRARLTITNDSASLHLASAVGTPTVALFGPTDAGKYGPTVEPHRTVRRRLFCAPCERALCRFNHECMRFITADEVFQKASELLQEGQGARGEGRGK